MLTTEKRIDELMECGYGGCRAPEAPTPMSDPRAEDSLHAGYGGCSAPARPEPIVAPGAAALWRWWRKRPAEA